MIYKKKEEGVNMKRTIKLKWFSRAVIVSLLLLGTSGFAEATSVTWNLTGPGSEGSLGNTRSFTDFGSGITVAASAWNYYDGSFRQANLGQWSTGLGVCNPSESNPCSSPSHQVDNQGSDDFVLFLFSAPVDPTTVRIDPYGTYDRDVSYWTGTVGTPISLTGVSYGGLGALGFSSRIDNDGTSSSSYRDVPIVSPFANALLFGPKYGGEGDGYDYFKITKLSASVPEPASLMLLGAGLVGILIWRRKSVKI
jgi:hypothetical protein